MQQLSFYKWYFYSIKVQIKIIIIEIKQFKNTESVKILRETIILAKQYKYYFIIWFITYSLTSKEKLDQLQHKTFTCKLRILMQRSKYQVVNYLSKCIFYYATRKKITSDHVTFEDNIKSNLERYGNKFYSLIHFLIKHSMSLLNSNCKNFHLIWATEYFLMMRFRH